MVIWTVFRGFLLKEGVNEDAAHVVVSETSSRYKVFCFCFSFYSSVWCRVVFLVFVCLRKLVSYES